MRRETPELYDDAAKLLAESRSVRVIGGGTKAGWGPLAEPDLELSTAALDRVREHNEGDLTAVLQAGVPLARAQEQFLAAGQMLALDPPLAGGGATIGGVVATGDSGPLRHRYGAARDLVVGMTVALPDGTVARAGGKVIKNVAGYDLPKLFAGSFGTLGAIVEVAVRLHPVGRTASISYASDDADALAGVAMKLTHARHEAEAIDVAWQDGQGRVLAQFAGAEAAAQAHAAAAALDGGAEDVADERTAWAEQRDRQRGELVLRVSTVQSRLADVFRAAERLGGGMVGRAALGLCWVRLPAAGGGAAVRELREALAPAACVLLDAPDDVRAAADPWGIPDGPELELMRRVRERFDPQRVLV